jgi:hypothetical protein
MFVVMHAGMMLGAFLFATRGRHEPPEAPREHAPVWLRVMVFDMSAPVIAWMLHRSHSRRSAAEMAAAVIVPAVPLVALQLSHAVRGTLGGPYTLVSMIALIVYRLSEYRAAAQSYA